MDLLQHARELYATGRMHDAFEAAQAACDRAPKDPGAWWLLGQIGQHTGMPAASDEAFRRASALDPALVLPHRVSADRFRTLIAGVLPALPVEVAVRLRSVAVRSNAVPTADQVRTGVDPDALSLRLLAPHDALLLFQVNHENRCGSEAALRTLITCSLGCW